MPRKNKRKTRRKIEVTGKNWTNIRLGKSQVVLKGFWGSKYKSQQTRKFTGIDFGGG